MSALRQVHSAHIHKQTGKEVTSVTKQQPVLN